MTNAWSLGWVLTAVFTLAVSGVASAADGNRPVGRAFASRSEVIARNGMVATSHPLATQAALQTLREGGSAVDAAIAANSCLGLMEPTGCGVGGDLFAIVWDPKTRRLHGLNASGRSPRSLTLEEFRRKGLKRIASGGQLYLEHGFPSESVRELVRFGHKVGFTGAGNFGGFQGILWDRTNRVFIGATESRKDGHAAGW